MLEEIDRSGNKEIEHMQKTAVALGIAGVSMLVNPVVGLILLPEILHQVVLSARFYKQRNQAVTRVRKFLNTSR